MTKRETRKRGGSSSSQLGLQRFFEDAWDEEAFRKLIARIIITVLGVGLLIQGLRGKL